MSGLLTDTVGTVFYNVLSNPSGAVAATSAPNTLLTGTHEVLSVPPNASVGGGSYMLPVISSGATISCFVYTTTYAGQYSIAINNIYYLGIYINSSTQIQVGFNGTTFYQTVPTIPPNTWYFAAVTVTIGGNLYLYWGPANGSAPTQYLLSTVGSSPGTSLGTSTFASSAANNTAYYCSARFWANTALTSTQINQEAVSIVPVNTTGLSYHFLNPSALNITGLLTDTVGATQQIYSTNTQYAQQTPLNTITPTQALVYFDGYAYITTIPAVQANTWYFYAVTGTVGGNVYLYLGQVGTTPTQYLCTSSAVAGTTGTDYVYFDQTSTGSSYAGSLRYWGAAALTQGQVNAEAASIIPVTSGLSYHFLNPQATSLTSLLTDTVGGSQVLANSSCTIISGAPPISPTLAVNFNGITYTASNIPAILANTWYFYAISATSGSNPTLYWGPAGTTPIAYSTTGSGTQASGADYVYFDQSSSGQSYACSLRYWNATGLTSSQIIQEASSLTPYNTTGLTYHFLSPNSSSITGLLTDTVGNTTTPLVNTGSQYDATIDLPATFIPPNVGALYLPSPGYNVGYNGATGTSLSAVTSAATISGFVYSTSGAGITTKYSLSFGYFPGISYTQGSSTINVYFNKLSDGYASLPAPAANTWYFFAVTAVSGGSVYLYWGQVGSAPAQYGPLTMSGTASSGTDYVYIDQNGGTGSSYACSFRYWNGVALSATQVNQEAASLLPVNTSGLTYHFLDPRSTNIAGAGAAGSLLNDTWGNGGYLANNSCAYSTGVPTTKGALYIPASGNNVISGTAILPSVVSASAAGFIYLTGSAAVTTTSQSRYPSIFTPAPGGTSVNIYMNGVSQGSGVTLSTGVVANTWYFFAITGTTGGSIYFYWGPAGTIPIQYLVTSSATGIAQADSVYVRQSGTGISYVSSLRYWTTSALTQAQINAEALSLTPVITPTHHYLSPSSTSLGTSGTASANTLITDTINPANNTYALTYTASTVQYSTQVPNITVPTLSTGIIPVEPQVNPTTGSSSTTFMNGGTTLCSFMGAANASGISGGQDAAVISTTYDDYAPQTGGDTANGYVGMAGRTDGYTGGAAGAASGFSQGGGGAGPGSAGAAGGVIGASALANTGAGGGGGAVSAGQGGSGLANLTWWPGMASKTFLANGSWTAPAGYAGPVVCVGCGGGGGSETSSTAGGGGATLQYGMFQATPNQVYTVTVGAGGTSGATAGGVTKIVNNNGAVQVYGAIGGGGSSGSNPGRNNPVSSTSITTPDASSGGNASTAGNTGYDNTYAGGAAVSTTGGGGAGPYGAGASGGQSAAANTGAGAGAGGYTGGSGQVTIYWWPDGGAACEVFNSNGTFVCPSGVTKILLWGFGGGGGGSTGLTAGTVSSNSGGYGGGGSTASLVAVNVTPGASYVVTIGAGGAGGLSTYKNPNWKIANGSPGLATSFGSLASFMGGGEGGFDGGSSDTTHPNSGKFTQGNSNIVGWGGGRASGTFYGPGNISWQGYGGGAAGANNVYAGGFGGGGGPVGAGGSGGAGAANSSSAGSAGISAAANTGAGGGGGGGQLNTLTSIQYGSGGNGGSGQLIVCWWI